MQVQPPMICLLCGSFGPFLSEEHIIPHSLGNDLIVLAPGWVCDACNNICSAFESRALSTSILGLERCRLGVVTKKRKPARASLYGVTWFADPGARENIVSAEADWQKAPIFQRKDSAKFSIFMALHDETNYDLARLLLKIGVEILAVRESQQSKSLFQDAKDVVLGNSTLPWPYFVLRDKTVFSRLISVFDAAPDAREYIRSLGFDLYLHEIENEHVIFFQYGEFAAAVSLSSRSIDWIEAFNKWGVSYVGCPKEYSHLHG